MQIILRSPHDMCSDILCDTIGHGFYKSTIAVDKQWPQFCLHSSFGCLMGTQACVTWRSLDPVTIRTIRRVCLVYKEPNRSTFEVE